MQWNKSTPLYIAATNGHVEVVRLLVQAGANLDQADQVRGAPLTSYSHKAISLPSAGYVTLLVLQGSTRFEGWCKAHLSFALFENHVLLLSVRKHCTECGQERSLSQGAA